MCCRSSGVRASLQSSAVARLNCAEQRCIRFPENLCICGEPKLARAREHPIVAARCEAVQQLPMGEKVSCSVAVYKAINYMTSLAARLPRIQGDCQQTGPCMTI